MSGVSVKMPWHTPLHSSQVHPFTKQPQSHQLILLLRLLRLLCLLPLLLP